VPEERVGHLSAYRPQPSITRVLGHHLRTRGRPVVTGTVKWSDAQKGSGFIPQDACGADLFVHHSAIDGTGFKSLKVGQHMQVETAQGTNGLQANAIRPA
jgi:cold shock protein